MRIKDPSPQKILSYIKIKNAKYARFSTGKFQFDLN